MLVPQAKEIESILNTDMEELQKTLKGISNTNLMDSFAKNFTYLNDYRPTKKSIQSEIIIDFSYVYITEIRIRLEKIARQGNKAAMLEFVYLINRLYKEDKSIELTYMTRNLMRIRREAERWLETTFNMDKKAMRKEWIR